MRIGVIGAGAIGCTIGGRLALGGADVVLVGRPWLAEKLRSGSPGLALSRGHEPPVQVPRERIRVETSTDAVADCDAVLVTTKSKDTRAAGRALRGILRPGTPVGSLQNGVRNAEVLAEELPDRPIWPAMVAFNAVWIDDRLHQGTSGPVVLPTEARDLVQTLVAGRCEARVHREVRAVQWAKLLINLNNAVNALSGLPLRQMLADRGYRRVLAAVIDEGRWVLRTAGIRVIGVGRLRPALVPFLLRLPDAVFFRAAAAMVRVDPEARASMADDLARGLLTEVDELNGEIVAAGARAGVAAPLNGALVDLVHRAESDGLAPWSAPALAEALGMRGGSG